MINKAVAKKERWKPIPGHPLYSASSLGRIMNNRSGRVLKHFQINTGYNYVRLSRGTANSALGVSVHRLVLTAFRGEPRGLQADHINGTRDDNRLQNLEWVSQRLNIKRAARRNGGWKGQHNHHAKLNELQARIIIRCRGLQVVRKRLAEWWGVSGTCISYIYARKGWRNLK